MFKARLVAWLCFTFGWVHAVRAQDAEVPFLLGDPPRADDEWNSEYDGTWDPDWDRAFTQSGAPWQLSVAGGARQAGDGPSTSQSGASGSAQREYYALATLQLPLDQLPSKSVRSRADSLDPSRVAKSAPRATSEQSSAPAPAHQSATRASERTAAPHDAPSTPSASATAARGVGSGIGAVDPTRAQRILLRQTLTLTEQLMDRVTGTVSDRAALKALSSLTKRSRWSGLVPELRLRGVYGFDRTVSQQDSSGIYPGDLTTRGGHDSLIEGRLSFRLDRLVYGDQEAGLNQRRREIRLHEEKRKRDALVLLSTWLDARRRRAHPDLAPEQLFKLLREEQEALLSLYIMSDGWFEGEATLQRLGYMELLGAVEGTTTEDLLEADNLAEPDSATTAPPGAKDAEANQPNDPGDR